MSAPHKTRTPCAFSLVELLIVIAVIAIMASLVISAFSNAAADSRNVLAGQQQAVLQEAVNSWIAHASSAPNSLKEARDEFAGAGTSTARLEKVKDYLDDRTYTHFRDSSASGDGSKILSDALIKTDQYLEITDWPADSYPKVYKRSAQ
jgi:prepilin-type N-terminal cleavage/methylation domain-containing protein